MTIEISLEDGKYTYRRDEETGEQTALRYGEEWRDLVGDNFVAAMADRILDLQHKLSEKSPAAKTVDWGMMEEPTQQELDRIRGVNPGDVLLDEVGAKLQSKLDAVTTWSAADWAEVLSYADEETLAKLPNFTACPFPCGWQTLHKIAVQDAAFLAKFNWPEDEEGVSVPKAVAMRSMDYLIQICRAMLSQSASQKEAPVSRVDGLAECPTQGMTLGQRIAHVGGRENAQGHVEFGSPMAVHALIQHVLRDFHRQGRANLAPAQEDADKVDAERYRFIRDGKQDVWCSSGDDLLTSDNLDAAIDAARQEKKE